MQTQQKIDAYIRSLTGTKQSDLLALHQLIVSLDPAIRLWYESGLNDDGKVVSNPNIGYGLHTMQYANGSSKSIFKLSISATSTGISIYVMGVKDKSYLAKTFSETIGKAKITGYCIKFKSLSDLDNAVLKEVITWGLKS